MTHTVSQSPFGFRRTISVLGILLCPLLLISGCSRQATEAEETAAEAGKTGSKGAGKNALAGSASPYLVSHANDPVDWHPWGPDAFELARRENRPVLLSVGYASCHWCQEMDRSVFANSVIARTLNENFVCIKVDREERPDIDEIYTNALVVYNRMCDNPASGGWPLTMFLTPDAEAFAGGTFFPRRDDPQTGRPGLPTALRGVLRIWNSERAQVDELAGEITEAVRMISHPAPPTDPQPLSPKIVDLARTALLRKNDPLHGGFNFNGEETSVSELDDIPKFPLPQKIAFLLSECERNYDARTLATVEHTLDAMARGGIRDHLGGGFHRYATDRQWRRPHFEKMLYDQALLAGVYLEAYRQTRKDRHRLVAEEILDFVLMDLVDSEGAFVASLDSETEDRAGSYYLWTEEEIRNILPESEADLFVSTYGVDRSEALPGGHVLFMPRSLEQVAIDERMPIGELQRMLRHLREQLHAARELRPAPKTDPKIVTAWNGLAIRALADAGRVLDRPDYTRAADRAARFLLTRVRGADGRLYRSFVNGEPHGVAYLDDYANLISGVLALHEATGDERWIHAARRLTDVQMQYHWDDETAGFLLNARDGDALISEIKPAFDGVLPVANAVSVRNLTRLHAITGDEAYRDRAERTLVSLSSTWESLPGSTTDLAHAVSSFLFGQQQPTRRGGAAGNPAVTEELSTTPDRMGELEGSPRDLVRDFDEPPVVNNPPRVTLPPEPEITPEPTPSPEPSPNADDLRADGGFPPDAAKREIPKVTGRAFFNVRSLPAGGTCLVRIDLKVLEGWHINANPAQPDFVNATVFKVNSKHGSKLARVKYPKGKLIPIEGLDEQQSVYEGSVVILGELTVPANAGGQVEELELVIEYQACNDDKCLQNTVALKGKIAVTPAGQAVQPVNGHLFRR